MMYVSNNKGFGMLQGILASGFTALAIGSMVTASSVTQTLKKSENIINDIHAEVTGTNSCNGTLGGLNVGGTITVNNFAVGGEPVTQAYSQYNITNGDIVLTEVTPGPGGEQILRGNMSITNSRGQTNTKSITAIATVDTTGAIQRCDWADTKAARAVTCTEFGGNLQNGACVLGGKNNFQVSTTPNGMYEWTAGALSSLAYTNYLETLINRQENFQKSNALVGLLTILGNDPALNQGSKDAITAAIGYLNNQLANTTAMANIVHAYVDQERPTAAAVMNYWQLAKNARAAGGGETIPEIWIGQRTGSSYYRIGETAGESITTQKIPDPGKGFAVPLTQTAGP